MLWFIMIKMIVPTEQYPANTAGWNCFSSRLRMKIWSDGAVSSKYSTSLGSGSDFNCFDNYYFRITFHFLKKTKLLYETSQGLGCWSMGNTRAKPYPIHPQMFHFNLSKVNLIQIRSYANLPVSSILFINGRYWNFSCT